MALARTTVLSANSGAGHGTGTYTTGSFTPPDNSLLVVAVCAMEDSGSSDPSGDLTVSGGGWTHTARVNVGAVGLWSIGVRVWTAPVATAASMTLTFDCAARNIFRYVVSVVAYTGYDTSTPTGATGTNAAPGNDGAQSLTLSASPATTSEVVGVLGSDTNDASTPGTGWTEIHDRQALGDAGIQTQVRTGSTSSTVGWDNVAPGGSSDIVLAAVEILESAAPPPEPGFLDLESADEALLESGDIFVLEVGAPGGGETVTAGVGTINVSGVAGSPASGMVTLAAGVGTINVSGVAGSPTSGMVTVTAGVGLINLAGVAGSPASGMVTVAAGVGVINVSGVACSPASGMVTVTAGVGIINVQGVAGEFETEVVAAGIGTVNVSGVAASPESGMVTVTAGIGLVNVSGVAGSPVPGMVTVTGGVGTINVAGVAGSPASGMVTVAAGVGVIDISGVAGSPASGMVTVTAGVGLINVQGVAGEILSGETATAGVGTINVVGVAGSPTSGMVTVAAVPGIINIVGVAGSPASGMSTVTAVPGEIWITGVAGSVPVFGEPDRLLLAAYRDPSTLVPVRDRLYLVPIMED